MKQLNIVYQDASLVAVEKPARMLAVPNAGDDREESVQNILRAQIENPRLYPLHRLDYATSGIMVFGKDAGVRAELEAIFRTPTTRKKYITLVRGIPKYASGTITKKLRARNRNVYVAAKTTYRVVQKFQIPPCALVEAEISTGRKHQIRQHMASIFHPIILDNEYGDEKFNRQFRKILRLGRHFLHAASLEFIHPITQEHIVIEAPLPPDLQSIVKKLKSV
ncbi:hypothetical protein COV82_02385 [Candidatus Peregrinibacteria bacterium CG11_big_fil_rev_8_21_14_0_20_46_8]|nr:MAG: hypothetical protein COV82_02385 [Candidatus Peregrinibacteria bacterium CG11_big_fil_rev_8_21_14_0_20_46_8]